MPPISQPIIRLAIPVTADRQLQSRISTHFGKAPGYLIVDSNGDDCVYLAKPHPADRSRACAPIDTFAGQRVKVLVVRHMGRGALLRSHRAGCIILHAGDCRNAEDVLHAFAGGRLADLPDSALCDHSHRSGTHD